MAYFGKEFKLDRQENFDGFLKSLGLPLSEDQIKAILAHKTTAKLTKDGDSYTLTSLRPNNVNSVNTFKLGTEVDDEVDGNPAKSTFTMEGNALIQVQRIPGKNVTVTLKREFSDNEMVTTCTNSVWNGTAIRYFKA